MSEPIGPGDWVECVDASGSRPNTKSQLAKGGVYQVAAVREHPPRKSCAHCGECSCGLDLTTDDRADWGVWCPARFRQIYRPKSSIIEALKAPVLPEEVAVTRPAPAEGSPREPLRAKG